MVLWEGRVMFSKNCEYRPCSPVRTSGQPDFFDAVLNLPRPVPWVD